jgi:transposase
MAGKAAGVLITERQQAILRQLSVATTVTYRLRQRATIILLAFEKRLNRDIAAIVSLGPDQVGAWRRRWQQEFERLTVIEGSNDPSDLRRAIEELLADEQRSGRPPTFTAEQLTMIFSVACEAVEDSGRPVARWTQLEIIDEVIKRGIIKSISTSHMSTLLAEAQLQPHKSRYWLNTKEKDPEIFKQQMQTVCECYQQAPELLVQFDTHTVCKEEMTSIQALERIAPKKRCVPGRKNASNLNTSVMARCV